MPSILRPRERNLNIKIKKLRTKCKKINLVVYL